MKRMLVVVVLLVALLAPAVWLVAVGIGKGWPAGQLVLFGGIGLLCGCGLIVLVGGPVFLIWRLTGAPPPRIPLAPGETVLLELPANHWKGLEARRGKLSVTNRRLLFHAHRVNFQRDPLSIELAAVEGARPFALRRAGAVGPAGGRRRAGAADRSAGRHARRAASAGGRGVAQFGELTPLPTAASAPSSRSNRLVDGAAGALLDLPGRGARVLQERGVCSS
jgi:hypothetical protein